MLLLTLRRDLLTQSGVTHVLALEGLNDIGNARQDATPAAEDAPATSS